MSFSKVYAKLACGSVWGIQSDRRNGRSCSTQAARWRTMGHLWVVLSIPVGARLWRVKRKRLRR